MNGGMPQHLAETLPITAVRQIMAKAILDHLHCLRQREDPAELSSQLRMPAQFSADQDAISCFVGRQGGGRTHPDALTAGKALSGIEGRHSPPWHQGNRLLAADFHTGPTLRAESLSDLRPQRPDQSHVRDLRTGAGVGAIGNRNPKGMVAFQGPFDLFLEKAPQVGPLENLRQSLEQIPMVNRLIGTTPLAEAALHLIRLFHFLPHPQIVARN